MFILYIVTYTKDFKCVYLFSAHRQIISLHQVITDMQYSDNEKGLLEVDEELDTGQWPTFLQKISLFHRCFYEFYWENSTTWFIYKCNIGRKLVEINKSVYVIISYALKIIIMYLTLDA